MKKYTLLILAFFSINLYSQEKVKVSIRNQTNTTLAQIYLSPSASDFWNSDLLAGKTPIQNRETVDLFQTNEAKDYRYDLKAVSTDGQIFMIFEIKIIKNKTITIKESNLESKLNLKKEITPEQQESMQLKSNLPKRYVDGYKQGYLNGYDAGFKAGYASAKEEALDR